MKKKNYQTAYYKRIDDYITFHAAQRFVERVLKCDPSMLVGDHRIMKVKEEIYLHTKMFIGISGKFKIPIKEYDNTYAVIQDGKVLTVMEK